MSLSSEERAFLLGIVSQWDDDVPRLVYADWLEEQERNGRAEFIRLQCHLARALRDPEQAYLRSRLIDNIQDLVNQYSQAECYGERYYSEVISWGRMFRGFPDRVFIDLDEFAEFTADHLLGFGLPVEEIHLAAFLPPQFHELLNSQSLQYCRRLRLQQQQMTVVGFYEETLQVLLNAELPSNVQTVTLDPWVSPEAASLLLQTDPHKLHYQLRLDGSRWSNPDIASALKEHLGNRVTIIG
jgi:uncharacterized protein (TIGR02996 family)